MSSIGRTHLRNAINSQTTDLWFIRMLARLDDLDFRHFVAPAPPCTESDCEAIAVGAGLITAVLLEEETLWPKNPAASPELRPTCRHRCRESGGSSRRRWSCCRRCRRAPQRFPLRLLAPEGPSGDAASQTSPTVGASPQSWRGVPNVRLQRGGRGVSNWAQVAIVR